MSGIEVVGLVLGLVPVIMDACKSLMDCDKTAKLFRRQVTSLTETLETLQKHLGDPASTKIYPHSVSHDDCLDTERHRERIPHLLKDTRKVLEDCKTTIDEIQARDRLRRHIRIVVKGYQQEIVMPVHDQDLYACLEHYTSRLKASNIALNRCFSGTVSEEEEAPVAATLTPRNLHKVVIAVMGRTGAGKSAMVTLLNDRWTQEKHGSDVKVLEYAGIKLVDVPGFSPSHQESPSANHRQHPADDDEVSGWYSAFHEPPVIALKDFRSSATTFDREAEVLKKISETGFIHDASFFLTCALSKISGQPSSPLGRAKSLASPIPWRRNRQPPGFERVCKILASLGIVGAGIATGMLIYLRHTSPIFSGGRIKILVTNLSGAQTIVVYTLSLVTYGAVGLVNIMQQQRYWSDCALGTTLIAVVIGLTVGMETMLDALIVGGYVSLVAAKLLVCFMDLRSHRIKLSPREMLKTDEGLMPPNSM